MEGSTNRQNILKHLHLSISAILILSVGLIYGIWPGKILPMLFDFTVETKDLKNIFRAMMGLYVAIACFWLFAVFNPKYCRMATILNIIFMLGLAIGRLVGFALDGLPSFYFVLGMIVELLLALWGVRNLKNSNSCV